MSVRTIAAASLAQRVEKADKPLLVAVVRPAAKPSQTLLASLEQLGSDVKGLVDVVQVDMDEDAAVMDKLRVSYEPELLLYEGGRVVERTEGEMTPEQIGSLVRHSLGV